jgi:hypothetical protein
MKIKYLQNSRDIPVNYHQTNHSLNEPLVQKGPDGRMYQLLSLFEKDYINYSFKLLSLRVKTFCKIFFSFGLALLKEKVREDWEIARSGRRLVAVYQLQDENQIPKQEKGWKSSLIYLDETQAPQWIVLKLHSDIRSHLFSFLPINEVVRMGRVCTELNTFIHQNHLKSMPMLIQFQFLEYLIEARSKESKKVLSLNFTLLFLNL